MGFFKREPFICAICGTDYLQTSFKRCIKIKDATVCGGCLLTAGYTNVWNVSDLTLEDVRSKALPRLQSFREMREMPVDLTLGDLHIDTKGRRWYCRPNLLTGTGTHCQETEGVHSLDDVRVTTIERYVVEDVNTKTTSDGMSKAIVGGLLAGTTGAIIGAAGANQTTTGTSVSHHHFHIHLRFLRPAELAGKEYWLHLGSERELQQFLRWFKQEGEEEAAVPQETDTSAPDPASELRKYKALLEEGLITQQDFDAKKKQLLGL